MQKTGASACNPHAQDFDSGSTSVTYIIVGYEEARRGIVSPAQNTAYLAEDIVIAATNHNEGSSSGFSSWTKNKKVAEAFAGDEGVVLEAIVGPDHGQVRPLAVTLSNIIRDSCGLQTGRYQFPPS